MVLVELIGSNSFFALEFREVGHVGSSAEMPVMEEDHPLIFGELKVKLDIITLIESSLDAGEGVFREKAAVSSVCNDQRLLGHTCFK